MYNSNKMKIVTLLNMIQKVDVYDLNSFSYSDSLDDELVSDGESL